jgi:PAS domain-containing protein
VRDHAARIRRRAAGQDPEGSALALALEELDVTLEELWVAEEEIRGQQEALEGGQARSELERQRYQVLFQLAPAPYLVTDPVGVIGQANLRTVGLFGVDGRFVTASRWPPSSTEDRPRFRDRLARLSAVEQAEVRVLLCPRDRDRVQVVAWVAVGRDDAGVAQEPRWLLWPADAEAGAGRADVGAPAAASRPGRPRPCRRRRPTRPGRGPLRGCLRPQRGGVDARSPHRPTAQAAFERLRRQARARSRKVDDVAREVIAGRSLETGQGPAAQSRSTWRSPGPT